MIRPPHTFDAVVRELFRGLSDGTVVLEQEVGESSERPVGLARAAAAAANGTLGIAIHSPEDWVRATEPRSGFLTEIVPLAELEREAILRALEHFQGDKPRIARLLGIDEDSLEKKMKEYGLEDWPTLARSKTAEAGQI